CIVRAFFCLAVLSFFSFFLLLLRPPPTSTLFPYTTLFRSYFFNIAPKFFAGNNLCMMFHADLGAEFFGPADFIELFAKVESHGKDRKSTRLNSSHVSISYAVFCLKKKNNYVHEADTKPHHE